MQVKEFEQKIRQCIYHTNMHCVQEDSHEYVCYVGDDTMRILYREAHETWIIKTEIHTAYGDTLEECVQTIATTEGVRYFPGIVPTNQQFITTIESYLQSVGRDLKKVKYELFSDENVTIYNAVYDGAYSVISYSSEQHKPWYFAEYHAQGLPLTGVGDSLEEAVDECDR